jgi:hypothetical protein
MNVAANLASTHEPPAQAPATGQGGRESRSPTGERIQCPNAPEFGGRPSAGSRPYKAVSAKNANETNSCVQLTAAGRRSRAFERAGYRGPLPQHERN